MFITTTLIVVVVVAAAVVGGLVLQSSVGRYEPVRSARLGPFSVELRRRAIVRGHPNGRGGHAFAHPREARIRVFRVAGFAVWRQARNLELPLQVVNMIGTLTARDFDAEFDDRFRVASFAALTSTGAARRRIGEAGRSGSGRSGSGSAGSGSAGSGRRAH